MRDDFEGNQNTDDCAQDSKDQIHPKGNPVPDGLTIPLVYLNLVAPSASHDFPSGITFEQQPGEYCTYSQKERCEHYVLRRVPV